MSGVAGARGLLAADAGVSALVGTRVFRKVKRNATLPYVLLTRSDVDWRPTIDGTANRLVNETIDVDSVAVTAEQAVAIDKAVREALQDANEVTFDGITIAAVVIEGGAEDVTPPDNGDDVAVSIISQSYLVQWRN